MNNSNDILYSIFEKHLFNTESPTQSQDEFVAFVVCDYLSIIREKGPINCSHLAEICKDLEEEVLDMLQKKIYGHFDLVHYRQEMGIYENKKDS